MQAHAQNDSLPPPPKFSLGLIDGTDIIRLASGNPDHADHLLRNEGPKLGLDVGLCLNVAINSNVRLRFLPHVSLSSLPYKIVEKPFTGTFPLVPLNVLQTSNLNLPLMIQVKKRHYKMIRPWFQGGIQPTIDLAKRGNASTKRPPVTFGLAAGVGLDVIFGTFSFSPEIRFTQSLTNITNRIPHPNSQILPALFMQTLSLQIAFE